MITYKRVKASTLIKRGLPYCGNCQNLKVTETHFARRPDGYLPKSVNVSRECLCNGDGTLDKYRDYNGAGCPNFKERK